MRIRRRVRSLWTLHRFSSWRAMRRHPGTVSTVLVAVAIGSAAIVATGSLVESTLASFEASIREIAGDADLRISNGFVGVPEALIDDVGAVPGVAAAGAIVSTSAGVQLADSRSELLLIGIDLLGSDPVHGAAVGRDRFEIRDELDFVSRPNAVVLARSWAGERGIELGSSLRVDTRAGGRDLYVAGLLDPGVAAALAGGAVGVMDLPALQWLMKRNGIVDAIDVVVGDDALRDDVRKRLEAIVAGVATVAAVGRGRADVDSLLFNVRLILNIAGFIAILVSSLVIYHAVSIFVSRRQSEIDVIRSVGAPSRQVLTMFAVEALVLGGVGGAIGAVLGGAIAWVAQDLIGSSVTTLYTDLYATSFRISRGYLIMALALSLLVTLAATLAAAGIHRPLGVAAYYASPRQKRLERARRAGLLGAILVACSAGLTLLQNPSLSVGQLIVATTASDVLLLAGIALAGPGLILLLSPGMKRLVRGLRSTLPRLAWQGLSSDAGRTAMVLSSILVGLAYALITVAVVGSLQSFVFHWVDHSFRADLTVSAVGYTGILPSSPPIPRSIAEVLRSDSDVEHIEAIRVVTQPYRDRWIVVASRPAESFGTTYPVRVLAGDLEAARASIERGRTVAVSGHFAEKFGLAPGDSIELRTPSGPGTFQIGVVIEDFLADLGTVFVSPDTYRTLWRDDAVSGFHLWLRAGAAPASVKSRLASAIRNECDCAVLTGAEFRIGFNRMVNAAFQTAYALEVVAALVVIVAMISFFILTLQERRREIQVLREVGASRSQLLRCFLLEAGTIGFLGGVLGCLAGFLVSYRLVKTTMHASGGLSIDYVLPVWAIPTLLAGAVVVCVVSSLPPVLRFSRNPEDRLSETLDE